MCRAGGCGNIKKKGGGGGGGEMGEFHADVRI